MGVGVSVDSCMAVIMAVPGMVPGHVAFWHLPVLVTVVPQLGLVEQKEKHQAEQQHGKQFGWLDAALEGFGQQMHERSGEQCTGGKTEKMLWIDATSAVADTDAQQQRCQPDTSNSGKQCRGEDGNQDHED